jgi:hypothetical protein
MRTAQHKHNTLVQAGHGMDSLTDEWCVCRLHQVDLREVSHHRQDQLL